MQRRCFRPSLPAALAATAFLAAALPAQAQTGADAGSRIYAANCAACHQAGGTGLAGAFPPLAGHVADILKPADGRVYIGMVLLFGWSWALFYHLCNGIRHLIQDAGAGYAIPQFVRSSWLSVVLSLVLTAVVWAYVLTAGGAA